MPVYTAQQAKRQPYSYLLVATSMFHIMFSARVPLTVQQYISVLLVCVAEMKVTGVHVAEVLLEKACHV
jgi:hypothetical protein